MWFSDKSVYRRYTYPESKVFCVNKWTYLSNWCFLRRVFGIASGLGALSPVSSNRLLHHDQWERNSYRLNWMLPSIAPSDNDMIFIGNEIRSACALMKVDMQWSCFFCRSCTKARKTIWGFCIILPCNVLFENHKSDCTPHIVLIYFPLTIMKNSRSLTSRPWKMVVGRRSFPISNVKIPGAFRDH